MAWGSLELEPEVAQWVESLSDEDFARVMFYLDLLEDQGVLLDHPYTSQLRGKLRELRFHLGAGRPQRISYYVASGRRIVLLTVFLKSQRQERAEIERAWQAMQRCLEEEHTAEEE